MSAVDKALKYLVPFIGSRKDSSLIVIGVSGPQGSGKTYLSSHLSTRLHHAFPQLKCIDVSIDDFYLTFEDQQKLAKEYAENWLVSGRGPPGTHDLRLLEETMGKLSARLPNVTIPRYDKSAHGGRGDRAPESEWTSVGPVDVVILEGWFNGYTAIPEETLAPRWTEIQESKKPKFDKVTLSDVQFVNSQLKQYERIWARFDAFVYLTTNSIDNVYTWRKQQEHALIKERGVGMSDGEVELFVDRYMPSYYLYYDALAKNGCLATRNNCRIDIDITRRVATQPNL